MITLQIYDSAYYNGSQPLYNISFQKVKNGVQLTSDENNFYSNLSIVDIIKLNHHIGKQTWIESGSILFSETFMKLENGSLVIFNKDNKKIVIPSFDQISYFMDIINYVNEKDEVVEVNVSNNNNPLVSTSTQQQTNPLQQNTTSPFQNKGQNSGWGNSSNTSLGNMFK